MEDKISREKIAFEETGSPHLDKSYFELVTASWITKNKSNNNLIQKAAMSTYKTEMGFKKLGINP